MKKNLITLHAFIEAIYEDGTKNAEAKIKEIYEYAKFLSQPLTIDMFEGDKPLFDAENLNNTNTISRAQFMGWVKDLTVNYLAQEYEITYNIYP